MPSYWERSPATLLCATAERIAAEKHAAEVERTTTAGEDPPEPPPPLSEPLQAAAYLLADEGFKGCVTGAEAGEDFGAACEFVGITSAPHPAVVTALASLKPNAPLSLRGWALDLPSLTALIATLTGHASKVKSLKLWGCGMDADAVSLLAAHLPASITALAIEGEPLPETDAFAALAASEGLTSLSLRCADVGKANGGLPAGLASAVASSASLTTLSLFGNPIGDAAAIELLAALRPNASLTSLDLGRTSLSDAAAHAVLAMVNAPDAPTGEAEEETTTEEVAPAEEETETDPPNRSLTALNLSFNSISTKGRRSIEAAQAASEALTRVELKGNPCLTCGPTASLGAAGRAAIADTWAALAQLEGGAEGVMAKVLATALDETPAALPLVGYVEGSLGGESEPASSPSATPRDPKMPELSDGARVIIRWTGMARLATVVATAIEKLIAALNSPPALERHLRDDLGLVLASRGFPPGAPYDAFGESLVKGLANALGEEGFSEEAAAAWREAYASASECMQTAYTLSQLAAANAPPAEEEAEAEAAEAECE